MSKTALILGVGGQDGSYLAELLLDKGYHVHGLYRRSSVDNLWRVRHLVGQVDHLPSCGTKYRGCDPKCRKDQSERLVLHRGDLADPQSVDHIVRLSRPDEIYNMADQDDVRWSHDVPAWNLDITAGAVGRLLESVRQAAPETRVFQPVSSTMFGPAPPPQNEQTPLDPRSPYACAKACAWHLCRYYRRAYRLHVSCGVMFNHDSPRRGDGYLLHKIARGALRVADEFQDVLKLGNLFLELDIGWAKDYVAAAHAILQLPEPDDFVVGTGRGVKIRDLAAVALRAVGMSEDRIVLDPTFGPEPSLVADATKLRGVTDWQPARVEALVEALVLGMIDDPSVLEKPTV